MVESVFEYGPRVGCWRLLRIFKRFDVRISVLGVVRGLQMYPELRRAFVEEGTKSSAMVGVGSTITRWRTTKSASTSNSRSPALKN